MATRPSPILDADGSPCQVEQTETPRYRSHPAWSARNWEAAETTRLNSAHWSNAQDSAINLFLAENLPTLRTRSIYESRQNGMVTGVIKTHTDDVVGPDGPTLQVHCDPVNNAYSDALEGTWRNWFAAPTLRGNLSGTALLKLWIRKFWDCGEILSRIYTDPDAEGPVKMRLWPAHPRRLASPADRTGQPNVVMGIEFDELDRPVAYFLQDVAMNGQAGMSMNGHRWLANSIIHEFAVEEEDQARGFPWLTPGLTPAAELRDYDDQVLDAARQQADHAILLKTNHPAAPFWNVPESTTVERRQIVMNPPGWEAQFQPPSQPAAEYVSYRGERQREIGRPVGMPLLMVRLDASKHNYSSARLDTQGYDRGIAGIQSWLSGTERSYGTLNRLVDEVAAEARFSIPELRRRPARVQYDFTWPKRPHVDMSKEATGEAIGLQNLTVLFSEALAARGKNLETHILKLKRELQLFADAGLPIPGAWINNPSALLAMLAAETGANENTGATADGTAATQSA